MENLKEHIEKNAISKTLFQSLVYLDAEFGRATIEKYKDLQFYNYLFDKYGQLFDRALRCYYFDDIDFELFDYISDGCLDGRSYLHNSKLIYCE